MKTHKISSLAALFLAVAGGVQAEVLTENKTVTVADDTPYNSETDGVTLTFNVGSGEHEGAITGTLGVVVDITGQNKNGNRVTFSGSNTFTGGLTVKNGTLLGATGTNLGATSSTITLENATLMINGSNNPTVSHNVLINSDFGALRPSNSFTMAGKISGNGDFLVHCDTNKTLTLSNTNNDYTGITNIGGYNVPDSGNNNAGLKLGANEVLPNGTVVQLGVHYGTVNGNTKLAETWLDLNGKTETISGLMGVGKLQNSAMDATATLNIAMDKDSAFYAEHAGTEGYNFSGTITGDINLNITGNGTQIYGGTGSINALTFSEGNFKLASTADLTVKTITASGVSEFDLNGANLTSSSVPDFELTNSNNNDLSVFTYTGGAKQVTMPVITGNTRFVLNMSDNTNNDCRTTLVTYTELKGGVEIQRGTLRVDNTSILGDIPNKTIDFNGGALMTSTNWSNDYVFNMMAGGGAYRQTGGNPAQLDAYITGVGSFEVVNDGTVYINNQKNDYQGWTYIGTTGFRNSALGDPTKVYLGKDEVLPNTTVVQLGAGAVTGMNTLYLNGKTETVAGLTGGKTGTTVNGKLSGAGTLIIDDTENLTYSGNITDGANVQKVGSAIWTVDGNVDTTGTMSVTNGILNLKGNVNLAKAEVSGGTLNMTGTGTLTEVNVSGGNYIHAFQGTLQNMNLTGGTVKLAGGNLTDTAINGKSGESTIFMSADAYYLQEKFESQTVGSVDMNFYAKDFNVTENANQITNMDQWVNVWSAYYNQKDDSVWGTSGVLDKSVTNVFEMKLVNTNAEDITVDFGKSFHNDAQVMLMDGDTVVATLDWTNKTGVAANSTGTVTDVTLEAGKEYTLIVRASRYNRTIGAHNNGLNKDANAPIGIGVRESGTDLWFGMNLDGTGEWGWTGSGIYSTMLNDTLSTFAPKSLDIADGATVTLKMLPTSQNKLTTAATGTGTLKLANIGGTTGNAFMTMTAGVDGNLLVDSNVTLATENVTVGGTVTLAENAVLALNGETGTLTLNTLEGLGRIEVDLDSIANNENALIVFTETDLENIDLTGLTLELVSERSDEELVDEVYHLFAGIDLSEVEALKFDSKWNVGSDANGIYFTLRANPDSSVPEPATWGMLLVGIGGMLLVARKRERK